MEIAGYRDALDMIHSHHAEILFNENTVLRMHEIMMNIANYAHGGKYIPAHDSEEAMEQLVLAYMDARANSNINQLLLIPCVVLDFLCIHPFQDGNGRVSRLMSLLLMYKNIPFMENFLSTLYKCYKELDLRFSTINGKRLKKNQRIKQTVLNSVANIKI